MLGYAPRSADFGGASTHFMQPFKIVRLSRNLYQYMPKNEYFLEKVVAETPLASDGWEIRPQTPAFPIYKYSLAECISSVKLTLFFRKIREGTNDRCSAFVSSTDLLLFNSNSAVFVGGT